MWSGIIVLLIFTLALFQIIDATCIAYSCLQAGSNYFLNSQNRCQCVASRSCPSGKEWNSDRCECEDRCQVTTCSDGQRFNFNTCKCEACLGGLCPGGTLFNPTSCDCIPCKPQICLPGTRYDIESCRCIPEELPIGHWLESWLYYTLYCVLKYIYNYY